MSEPPGGGGVPATQFTGFAALQSNGIDLSHNGWRVPRVVDWNHDGKPDLLVGAGGYVWLYTNGGTAELPAFGSAGKVKAAGTDLYVGSSSSPIAWVDITGDGVKDLVVADSASKLRLYRNTAAGSQTPVLSAAVFVKTVSGADFVLPDRRFDLGDWNRDGKPDLVTGTYSGTMQLFLNQGTASDPRFSTGTTLLSDSYNLYPRLWFLKYQTLDVTNFHHVPSIVLQNWVLLQYALADTPAHRTNVAEVMGLTGTMRTIFLENGLALGDNAKSIPAAFGTIRDFQRRHPRELFPDAVLTIDQLYSDGRGGFVWTPNSTKNTFGDWAVGLANEWADDLTTAIEKVLGSGSASGDYFTFVMGHEVTHSLDGYVNSRANTDLRRRWGLLLCTAAGPDVIPDATGWWDWTATKANFQAKGYWDGSAATWNTAWSNYWAIGYGASFKNLSFMRFDISWFLGSPQESLATQANHHWANGLGRLIGATDRFRRASAPGMAPLRANLNEVVTFIDFLSAGMNRVNLVETKTQSSPKQVNWFDHYADLERDDRGYVRRITVEGQTYQFEVNTNGVVTNVVTSLLAPVNDVCWTFRDQPRAFDVLANDSRLEGGPVQLAGVTQPVHGTVAILTNGTLLYSPAAGYVGNDSFNYSVTSSAGGTAVASVALEVVNPAVATGALLVEYWLSLGGGTAVSDLTGNARFPASPSAKFYTNLSESLAFAKISGPGWLTVAADGTLSGTPASTEVGTNWFAVRVTDSAGFVDETAMRLRVLDLSTPPGVAVSRSGDTVTLHLTGILGQRYRVETAPSLPASGWNLWCDIPALPASPLALVDGPTNPQQFYRLVSLP